MAFALVAANDQDHMLRFLKNLKNWGLEPRVVVTDGSNLYPAVISELWSEADHQLCVFHVTMDINKLILDAVRRLRMAMSRRAKAGRKKKRGRKSRKAKIESLQWSGDFTLLVRGKTRIPFFGQGALPVPPEQKQAINELLQKHCPVWDRDF